jgi:hypothetical protein
MEDYVLIVKNVRIRFAHLENRKMMKGISDEKTVYSHGAIYIGLALF